MEIHMAQGVVRITCGGKPLDGPYLPPKSALQELGRYLAQKYGDKNETKETDLYEE